MSKILDTDVKRVIILNKNTHKQCEYTFDSKGCFCAYNNCPVDPNGRACDIFMAKSDKVWAKFLDSALVQKGLEGLK